MNKEADFPKYQPISKGKAILQGKCPKCRVGKMYTHFAYHPTKFTSMHKNCPHCDFEFEIEPGYWYGAMYVSYAINVAIIMTGMVVSLFLLPEIEVWYQVGIVLVPVFIFVPLSFRWARILYIHLFGQIEYEPKLSAPVDVTKLDVDFRKQKKS